MTNNVKVSVLTCLFKHKEEYVRQCLDSLVAQTLKECEFILIDNGADETNKALIKEYLKKDNRFCVIYLKQNIGMGAALNRGIDKAAGQYIGFLESDDFAEPNMFEDLYNKSNQGHIDVVKSIYQTLDEQGCIKQENNFPISQCGKVLSRGLCSGLIQGHVSHWSGIYKKSFLQKNHILFNETPGGHSQDFGFILKCYACADSVYVIPHAYVTYRLFTGVHEFKYLNDCMLDECELTFEYLRKNNLPKEVWEILFFRIAPRLKLCMQTADRKQRKRIIKEINKNAEFQSYKYFPLAVKNDIKNFIKANSWFYKVKKLIFQSRKTTVKTVKKFLGITYFKKSTDANKTTYKYLSGILKYIETKKTVSFYILGIPVVIKKDTPQKRYIKFFTIPVYYWHDNCYELKQQINNMSCILSNVVSKIQNNETLLNLKLSNIKSILEAETIHPKTFGKYRNAFNGKDVVLVCTGPTAKNYKPIKNAIHVGVNGAVYLDKIKLDYLFMQDYTIKQNCNSSLTKDGLSYEGNNCKKFWGKIPDDLNIANKKCNINRIPFSFSAGKDSVQYILEDYPLHNIAENLECEPMGQFLGTPFSALQFILYAHPKRLFFVGWDCGSGYAYNKPNAMGPANYQIEIMKKYFVPFIKLNYPDIKIVSINSVGLKGIFKDVYIN